MVEVNKYWNENNQINQSYKFELCFELVLTSFRFDYLKHKPKFVKSKETENAIKTLQICFMVNRQNSNHVVFFSVMSDLIMQTFLKYLFFCCKKRFLSIIKYIRQQQQLKSSSKKIVAGSFFQSICCILNRLISKNSLRTEVEKSEDCRAESGYPKTRFCLVIYKIHQRANRFACYCNKLDCIVLHMYNWLGLNVF